MLPCSIRHENKDWSGLSFLPSPFVTDFTDAVPLQSIAPRPMGSIVERIPIDCLYPPLSREVPSSQKLRLTNLPKRAEVAMFAALMPATERAATREP